MHLRIQTAREIHRAASPEHLLQLHALHVAGERAQLEALGCLDVAPRAREHEGQLEGRVDHGRWLANCLACRAGVAIAPGWDVACCFRCGAVYRAIVVPPAWRAIERVLAPRPTEHQNWMPCESLQALVEENVAHGVTT